jgi:hypothetical protein
MVILQYWTGEEWVNVDMWPNEKLAWAALGGDTFNYRVIDKDGKVLISDTVFDKTSNQK